MFISSSARTARSSVAHVRVSRAFSVKLRVSDDITRSLTCEQASLTNELFRLISLTERAVKHSVNQTKRRRAELCKWQIKRLKELAVVGTGLVLSLLSRPLG